MIVMEFTMNKPLPLVAALILLSVIAASLSNAHANPPVELATSARDHHSALVEETELRKALLPLNEARLEVCSSSSGSDLEVRVQDLSGDSISVTTAEINRAVQKDSSLRTAVCEDEAASASPAESQSSDSTSGSNGCMVNGIDCCKHPDRCE
jgi:hypothetical protein